MTALLIFQHRGIRGALPAGQAVGVVAHEDDDGSQVELWSGNALAQGRPLRVHAGGQLLSVKCQEVLLLEVERKGLLPLSPCLRAVLLDLPHVVGVVWLARGAAWLVDMSRFARRAA